MFPGMSVNKDVAEVPGFLRKQKRREYDKNFRNWKRIGRYYD